MIKVMYLVQVCAAKVAADLGLKLYSPNTELITLLTTIYFKDFLKNLHGNEVSCL